MPKVGDVVGLKGTLEGRGDPSDLFFKVITPTAQARTYHFGESTKVARLPTVVGKPQEYELKFPIEMPGRHIYEMYATLDGGETKAIGEFYADGSPIKIEREVSVGISEADDFGGEDKGFAETQTIHEMLSFSVPNVAVPEMPDVPLFPDIDIEAIRARDPNPVFITRLIGVLDGVSENDLEYDDYLMAEIERQVRAKRPPARSGHVPEDAKSWMVPDSVGRWVGVLRVGDFLYGKCYIYPGRAFHEDVQVSDAVGGQLATSIYGDATLSMNEDGRMKCVGLALESIDFVPPERAALQALGGEFEVTREMKLLGEMTMAEQDKNAMSDEQKKSVAEAYLRECSAATMKEMLSEVQRRDVASGCVAEMQAQAVYEMLSEAQRRDIAEAIISKITPEDVAGKIQESSRKALAESLAKGMGMKLTREEDEEVNETSIAEMKTLQKSISEMQTTIRRYEHDEFNRALDKSIADKFAHIPVRPGGDGEKKIATLKANLRPQAVAEMAGSTKMEDIQGAVDRAYESPSYKPLAEMTIQSLQGPSVIGGVQTLSGAPGNNPYGWNAQTGRYDEDAVARAQQKANTVGRG